MLQVECMRLVFGDVDSVLRFSACCAVTIRAPMLHFESDSCSSDSRCDTAAPAVPHIADGCMIVKNRQAHPQLARHYVALAHVNRPCLIGVCSSAMPEHCKRLSCCSPPLHGGCANRPGGVAAFDHNSTACSPG